MTSSNTKYKAQALAMEVDQILPNVLQSHPLQPNINLLPNSNKISKEGGEVRSDSVDKYHQPYSENSLQSVH